MKFTCVSLYFFLGLTLVPPALTSSGDRADEFRSCVAACQTRTCESSSPPPLPLALRLTRWTCVDDCKYQCMHLITDQAIQHGWPVRQYYGKWPFWRFAGMQEPASVLFSVLNFLAHWGGARKIQTRIPDAHPMKKYYTMFALASMNAWVWSSVFHTRDLPITEKLDYFSAALAILYGLYYAVIRLFHIYPTERYRLTAGSPSSSRSGIYVAWTLVCCLAFLAHVSYLSLLPRFDYTYNMIFNLAVGMAHNLFWILYSLPSSLSLIHHYPGLPHNYRPRHTHKPAVFALLTTAATGLELFDFPPWAGTIDAHSLWHLATVPIAVFWYDFLIEDARHEGWRPMKL